MKNWVWVFYLPLLFLTSCQKNQLSTGANGVSQNYTPPESGASGPVSQQGPFSFSAIVISPNPVHKGYPSSLTAIATGTNLTFKWTTSHGDLFGSGDKIYYSDSCIGTYSVTCVVSDGTHTATITVPITISQ